MDTGQASPGAAQMVSTSPGRQEALTPTAWIRMAISMGSLSPSPICTILNVTRTSLVKQIHELWQYYSNHTAVGGIILP